MRIFRDTRTIMGARGDNRSKVAPAIIGTSGTPSTIGTSLGQFVPTFGSGYISDNLRTNSLFQSYIAYLYSLLDFRSIIAIFEKYAFPFQKGHFYSPAPPSEKQDGRLLPSALFPASLRISSQMKLHWRVWLFVD